MAKIISQNSNGEVVVQRRTKHIGISAVYNNSYSIVYEREEITTLNGEVIKTETLPLKEVTPNMSQLITVNNKTLTIGEIAQFIAQYIDDLDS